MNLISLRATIKDGVILDCLQLLQMVTCPATV